MLLYLIKSVIAVYSGQHLSSTDLGGGGNISQFPEGDEVLLYSITGCIVFIPTVNTFWSRAPE